MKRRFSLSLAMLLILSLILACGALADAAPALELPGDDDPLYNPVGMYPIVKQPLQLRLFMSMSGQTDFDANEYTQYIEQKTGIDLVFETCPASSQDEKLNLLLSTGDYPDMFFTSGIDENRYGVEEGILIDLAPYLVYCPNYQAEVKEFPLMTTVATAVDGKMYHLAAYASCYQCEYWNRMWINNPMLESMGEKAPTTTEEFYNLLKKFKEIYPEGMPLVGNAGNDPFSFLSGSFFDSFNGSYGFYNDGGKVVTPLTSDAYRECLRFINNKLFDEKLLNEDLYTFDANTLPGLLEQGTPVLFVPSGAAIFFGDVPGNPDVYRGFGVISPLAGPTGKRTTSYGAVYPNKAFAISNKCKDVQAAIRFADTFYTTEELLNSQFGAKGTYWLDADPGSLGVDGKPALYKLTQANAGDNTNWLFRGAYHWGNRGYGEQMPADLDLGIPLYHRQQLHLFSEEFYAPYTPTDGTALPPLKFTAEESASIQTIAVEVSKLMEETRAQFVTGILDIDNDNDWNSYVSGLESAGLPKLIEVYQAALDRSPK